MAGENNGPLWSPDGRELFYWSTSTQAMMVASITDSPEFPIEKPRQLFDGSAYPLNNMATSLHYDIAPEGDRFVIVKPVRAREPEVVVKLNWFEELERLLPTTKPAHPNS